MYWRRQATRSQVRWLAACVVIGSVVAGCGDDDTGTPQTPNTPPTFTTPPAASAASVQERASIRLTTAATDADGSQVRYAWSQVSPADPAGTFSAENARETEWTAPRVTASTPFKLRVTISDGVASVTGDVDVTVTDGAANGAPTISSIMVTPSSVAGSDVFLKVTATDPDGDPLTYAWTQTVGAAGTFVDATLKDAKWRSPAIGADGSFTIKITVSDGEATATDTETVSVTVPRFAADIHAPIIDQTCAASCHGAGTGGGPGDFTTAANAYASLVNVNSGCMSLKRVLPNQPDMSALIKKIEGTTCGSRMPKGNEEYFTQNPGDLIKIRSWILGGALNN